MSVIRILVRARTWYGSWYGIWTKWFGTEIRTTYRTNKNSVPNSVPRTALRQFVPTVRSSMFINLSKIRRTRVKFVPKFFFRNFRLQILTNFEVESFWFRRYFVKYNWSNGIMVVVSLSWRCCKGVNYIYTNLSTG